MAALVPLGKAWPLDRLASLGAISPEADAKIRAWLDVLVTWNAKLDLTAARTTEELLDLMVADALVLAQHVDEGASVVDVGTGAGAPGLPLALLRPDLRVTLAEPLVKRVSFLRTALGTVHRSDVRVERARGEELVAKGEKFDVAISRATLAPPEWIALAEDLATNEAWVLLAREDAPRGKRFEEVELVEYSWPLTGVQRKAAAYRPL